MKKTIKYFKNNKMVIITLTLTTILFILLSYLIITNKTSYIDSLVHANLITLRNNSLTAIMKLITNLGGATFLIILSVLLLIISKHKKSAVYITINLACAFLTNEIAKNIFTRSRPIGINLVEETGLSYPSGHSMVSLSFYGFIAYLLYKNAKSKTIKVNIILSLILIVTLIGFSRIYLGVHYLSDVIGGFLLSIIYLTIYIKSIKLEKK